MKRYFILISIVTLLFSIYSCKSDKPLKVYETPEELVADVEKNVKQISPEEFKLMIDSSQTFILVDVREKDEHDGGYIPGSILIPRGVLEFRVGKAETWENEGLYAPLKEDLIIVYCKLGHRGVLAAETLTKLGYKNVKALKGGWTEWNKLYPEIMEKIEVPEGTGATSGGSKSGGC